MEIMRTSPPAHYLAPTREEMREAAQVAELKEFSRDLQTEMLKAFATFTEANTLRFRGIEADVSNNRTGSGFGKTSSSAVYSKSKRN